jgi:hypothetical protein
VGCSEPLLASLADGGLPLKKGPGLSSDVSEFGPIFLEPERPAGLAARSGLRHAFTAIQHGFDESVRDALNPHGPPGGAPVIATDGSAWITSDGGWRPQGSR